MHLRCGGIVNNYFITGLVTTESGGERIFLKIGQHLAKLWTK